MDKLAELISQGSSWKRFAPPVSKEVRNFISPLHTPNAWGQELRIQCKTEQGTKGGHKNIITMVEIEQIGCLVLLFVSAIPARYQMNNEKMLPLRCQIWILMPILIGNKLVKQVQVQRLMINKENPSYFIIFSRPQKAISMKNVHTLAEKSSITLPIEFPILKLQYESHIGW